MRRRFSVVALWPLLFTSLAGTALAQADRAAIAPLEMLTCKFVAGKGPADLDGLALAYNGWMEKTRAPAYSAYALLPQAYSRDVDFDVLWLGEWPDGATMGESMAHRLANGSEVRAALGSVMTCDSNRNFSVVTLRDPPAPGRFDPLEITTCTLRLGVATNDALAAVDEWVEYTASVGSTAAHWLLFPAYGERADARYAFKWAVGYESYEAFGRDYDQATNGESFDKYNDLFGPLLQCDSPRLYSVRTIRPRPR
jgi:hypothetical protein